MDKKLLVLIAVLLTLLMAAPALASTSFEFGNGLFSGADLTEANLTPTPTSAPAETPTPTELPHPERWEWTPPPPPPPSKGVFEIGFAIIGILLIGLIVLGYVILRPKQPKE